MAYDDFGRFGAALAAAGSHDHEAPGLVLFAESVPFFARDLLSNHRGCGRGFRRERSNRIEWSLQHALVRDTAMGNFVPY